MAIDIHLDLFRKKRTDISTQGVLNCNDQFLCHTLEDKDRGLKSTMRSEDCKVKKVYGETCIASGVYEIVLIESPKRGYVVPQLMGVKAFNAIQMHKGNFVKDSLGCILVGDVLGNDEILQSTPAFKRMMEKFNECKKNGGRIFITIHD